MIHGDFTTEGRLSQHLRDMQLILSTASEAGVNLPFAKTVSEIFDRAEAAGLGQADNSAIIQAVRQSVELSRVDSGIHAPHFVSDPITKTEPLQ